MTLAERLRTEGGLLAAATVDGDVPFTAVEAIREGELAHYETGRVLRTDDADLALLAGDHLYALGLADLAERGDLDAITRLARVIARCAQARADGLSSDAAWSNL